MLCRREHARTSCRSNEVTAAVHMLHATVSQSVFSRHVYIKAGATVEDVAEDDAWNRKDSLIIYVNVGIPLQSYAMIVP